MPATTDSKRLKRLQDRKAALVAQMNSLLEGADAEGRDLTEEETKEYAAHEQELSSVQASLAREEKLQEHSRSLRSVRDLNEDTPEEAVARYDRLPAEAKKPENEDPRCGFDSHRDFLVSVMNAGMSLGRRVDSRLKPLAAAQWQAAAGADEQSTISDPYGGFLIPPAFAPNLMSVMAEEDPISSYTTKIPMSSPTVKIPARVDKNHTSSVSGGLRVYRRAETDDTASSRIEFEKVELHAASLMGVAYATEEVLERSPMSFIAILEAGFRDEFASVLIKERLFGTGVGEFEGVMNSPCLVSISKETGQAGTTVVYENIVKMRARCWKYSNAIWLANHDTLPQLMLLNQSVGTGGAVIWQPSAREDHPDTLLGRPLFFTEFCKTLGTTGDIILGNWTQYLEGTLAPVRQAESMHVRFLNHERTFKFWLENAGRCWWRSALTVNQGSNSLSPFVALATRS